MTMPDDLVTIDSLKFLGFFVRDTEPSYADLVITNDYEHTLLLRVSIPSWDVQLLQSRTPDGDPLKGSELLHGFALPNTKLKTHRDVVKLLEVFGCPVPQLPNDMIFAAERLRQLAADIEDGQVFYDTALCHYVPVTNEETGDAVVDSKLAGTTLILSTLGTTAKQVRWLRAILEGGAQFARLSDVPDESRSRAIFSEDDRDELRRLLARFEFLITQSAHRQ